MAKKFIELLEAAALIILTAACVVGVMKHLDSHKDEPTEDTPIVEELPEEELPGDELPGEDGLLSLTINFYNSSRTPVTIKYEEGMTWEEWCNSEYNTFGAYMDAVYVNFDFDGEIANLYFIGNRIPGEYPPDVVPSDIISDNVIFNNID